MSIRTASKVFEVPKSTIHENVKKLQNKEKINNVRGRATVLSKQIEELIVQAIMKLADWGFNLTDKDSLGIIKTYLDNIGSNAFRNNKPGYKFLTLFKNRWKHVLSERKAQNLAMNRAQSLNSTNLDLFL